jgi:glycosyltransferase involved in cell wall biosynthesis
MACKLPIVSSNLEPMKSMIGKGGILVNCLRPLSISRGIETFINSKKLRYKKAELAYKRSLKFSEKIMAKKTINFLYSFKQN